MSDTNERSVASAGSVEPVAWGLQRPDGSLRVGTYPPECEPEAKEYAALTGDVAVPLYTSPPDWAFLNDENDRLRRAIRRLVGH